MSAGNQLAQAVHAAFEFSVYNPHLTLPWVNTSNYLVVVAAPDEAGVRDLAQRCRDNGIAFRVIHEPDFNDEATAIAMAPGDVARKLCASLPLAMKERVVI